MQIGVCALQMGAGRSSQQVDFWRLLFSSGLYSRSGAYRRIARSCDRMPHPPI